MSLNLIAMLVSLAMMLTGAGVEGQPAEAARVATLRNLVVTYNGETLRLAPEAHVGVSTDGERALFDFGVDLAGDALLPIQVGVDDSGITALFAESGEAVTVTAEALEKAAGEMPVINTDLVRFITGEYLPAYTAAIRTMSGPEGLARIRQAGQAAFDKLVDRGEGTPDTVEVEGETYEVTAYSYMLDSAQLGALADGIYASVPELSDYYAAVFKLYSLLPEESGLTDIDSFSALMERTGMDVTLDVEEKMTDDGQVDVMDVVMTMDLSAAMGGIEPEGDPEDDEEEAAGPEGDEADEDIEDTGDAEDVEAAEVPEPVVMNGHTVQVGDFITSELTCDYDVDGEHGFQLTAVSTQESAAIDLDVDITLTENGIRTQRDRMTMFLARDDEGGISYSAGFKNVVQDTSKMEASCYGIKAPDGASENSFYLALRTAAGESGEDSFPVTIGTGDVNLSVSFDVDVTADAIADAVTGREGAYVIDDLTADFTSDATLSALMMKVGGSLGLDAGKLTGEKSVARLMGLMKGEGLPIDVDDIDEDEAYDMTYDVGGDGDYSYVIDGGEDEEPGVDFEGEEVEDDGVLAFNEPTLGWLPEGWTVADTNADTAYDWVEMSVLDGDGNDSAYAIFFADPEADSTNFIVQEDGKVVEGREINVTDFGEGGLSVTVREGGVYGNMMFTSEAVDVETIGRIVAGIEF